MPEQSLVDAATIEERIEDQLLGVLVDPRRGRQRRTGAAAGQFPEQHQQRQYDQGRHNPRRGLARHLDIFFGARRSLRRHRDDRRRRRRAHRDGFGLYGRHIHRKCISVFNVRDRTRERSRFDQTSTRLMVRDFRYAAGFSGSNTLPSKKVSLPRDLELGISEAATPRAFAASRQISSRLTLAISALASRPASYLPQRISSVRNQRSWL